MHMEVMEIHLRCAYVTGLSVAEAKVVQGHIAHNRLYEVCGMWFREGHLRALKVPIAPKLWRIGLGTFVTKKTQEIILYIYVHNS